MDLDDLAFLLGGADAEPETNADYRNIWVLAERSDAGLHRVTRQVLGKARELADRLGVRLEAVLAGGSAADARQLVALGADQVYHFEHPMLEGQAADALIPPLAEFVEARRPEIVLAPATARGTQWAARLAERLDTGVVALASGLELDEAERRLVITRQSFGGRALADVIIPRKRPQMVTVKANAFAEAVRDEGRSGEVETVAPLVGTPRVTVDSQEAFSAPVPLERARAVVVVGKGVGDAEGVALVKRFAEAIGAVLAGTHSAIEAGWLEESQEVSTRQRVIAPDLYIGIGVSGSMEHLDAMRQSRVIVAINVKPDTPLMEVADYAVVGDFRALVGAMLERLGAPTGKAVAV